MTIPSTFVAYPSDKHVADSMHRLVEDLRAAGADIVDWKDLQNPGFLVPPILESIDNTDLLLAETTSGNPNVLFELGYAIAKGKTTFHLLDRNRSQPQLIPALETVRYIEYAKRQEIVDFLKEVAPDTESLAEQIGIASVEERRGGLYFVPSRMDSDINETIWNRCLDSSFECATIDKLDSDYNSLQSQARSIFEADIFVTVLMNESSDGYWEANAQLMLFAGIAEGLGKSIVVLVHQPLRRILDLSDSALAFESETDAEIKLDRRLKAITAEFLRVTQPRRSVAPQRTSPLTGLFFGSLDARADFNLADYFIDTPEYKQAEAGKRHLFVGSKGSGKTANFEHLRACFDGRNHVVVSIAPADFEFPRLAAVFDEHLDLATWEFVYGSFWRFILVTEIMKSIREKYFDHLLVESSSDYAAHLIEWLQQNEDLLSLDFVSRVTNVLSKIPRKGEGLAERRTRLEALLQIARLYELEEDIKRFADDFEIRMFIDDLDRNWSPMHESANHLILALLNEVQALMNTLRPNLKITIFVRRDVFDWLVEQDQEFLKRDPAVLRWNSDSLEVMIGSRIKKHLGSTEEDPSLLWAEVFPETVGGMRTQDFIIERTLLRPRDVIQFCQKAAESAQRAGRESISDSDVYDAWEPTGELILAQAETEYATRFPRLGEVVYCLLEAPIVMPAADALARLAREASSMKDRPRWIEDAINDPTDFIEILYQIGIVGVRTAGGSTWYARDRSFREVYSKPSTPSSSIFDKIRAVFRQNDPVDTLSIVIHPAFQRYFRST